jgi:hypothetical protein
MCLIRAKLDCHDSLSPIFAWRAKGYRCCVNSIKTGRLIEQCSLKISRSFLWKKKAFIWKRIIFKRPGMVPKSRLERTLLKGKNELFINVIRSIDHVAIVSSQFNNAIFLILISDILDYFWSTAFLSVVHVTYSPVLYYRVCKLEFMAFLVQN